MKYIYNLTFKMAISAMISLAICQRFGIKYGTVAAVISILSIQSTKRQALKISKNRLLACSLGILISMLIYSLLGNSFWVFGLFLIIFIPITTYLKVEEGMVAAVVLSNHILIATNIGSGILINEFLLMIIGIGVAFIANLFMPSFDKEYLKHKEEIELGFKIIISEMSKGLLTHCIDSKVTVTFFEIENIIFKSEKKATSIMNNNLLKANTYYLDYILMRKAQFNIIKKMLKHFDKFYKSYEQTTIISEYIQKISYNMSENNDCLKLLNELDGLREYFKEMELPKTREEFENRAQLLHFLNDIEDFLTIKRAFMFKNKKT